MPRSYSSGRRRGGKRSSRSSGMYGKRGGGFRRSTSRGTRSGGMSSARSSARPRRAVSGNSRRQTVRIVVEHRSPGSGLTSPAEGLLGLKPGTPTNPKARV